MHKNDNTSSVIYNLNKLLKTFFNYAIKEGYILSNPCFKAVIPSDEKEIGNDDKEVDPLTNEDIEKLKKVLKGDLRTLVLLDLGAGLRKGELLGLSVKDIDLENKEIKIIKALKNVKIISDDGSSEYKVILDIPKTKNSIRSVPIPSTLIIMLKEHIESQQQKYIAKGIPFNGDSLVFTSESWNHVCHLTEKIFLGRSKGV